MANSVKLLFCTSSYSGNSGNALNERQLINALSKKVSCIFVLNLLDISLLLPAYKKSLYLKSNRSNIKIINIPLIPPIPISLILPYTIRLLFYNILMVTFAIGMKKLRLINSIYIRNPENALAFATFKKYSGPFALKFAGFNTQEGLISMKGKFKKSLFFYIFEKINNYAVNKSDLLLIHSSNYKNELEERYSVNKTKRMLIIPSGIDLETIKRIREDHKKIEEAQKSKTPTIGLVSSITWWDGLDILLESMPEVLKTHPNVSLTFVLGLGDVSLLNNLKSRAQQLGIPVCFKGPLSHENALLEMCQLSALVLPRRRTLSTEITIPIKVKEAFGLGIPVIVTRHKVFEECFRDLEDLIFVEPNPKDVAEKVTLLLSDPALAQHLSSKGLEMAANFSYDNLSGKFADALFAMSCQNKKETASLSITTCR